MLRAMDFSINLCSNFFDEIDEKVKQLQNLRPFSKITLKSLKESNILDWTYNSNAIEGNTLTLRETKVVLEGITVGGKSVKEHLEAINHKHAIAYLEELVGEKSGISEWNIKNLHQLILKGIDDENAGRYRNENVIISGATHVPPDHTKISELMGKLVKNYSKWNSSSSPCKSLVTAWRICKNASIYRRKWKNCKINNELRFNAKRICPCNYKKRKQTRIL